MSGVFRRAQKVVKRLRSSAGCGRNAGRVSDVWTRNGTTRVLLWYGGIQAAVPPLALVSGGVASSQPLLVYLQTDVVVLLRDLETSG